MRILLTGASGFLGRQCVPLLLAKGHEVHAVSFSTDAQNKRNLFWHQADLLDPDTSGRLIAEIRPTHLLHLAWYAEPGKYWTSLENFRWVQASLALLQAFAAHGGKRVVMAGSCAEYDWSYGCCSEASTPLKPATLYGACKLATQTMLGAFSQETGLSSAWGRIFFLYGPHEHPDRLVASVIRSLLRGEVARCSSGHQVRDFLSVERAASAFVALLESSVQGPVNIASGVPVTIRDLVTTIGERIGRTDLIRFGEIPARAGDPTVLTADVTRLREEMNWRPGDLEKDLDATIAWWREHLHQEAQGSAR